MAIILSGGHFCAQFKMMTEETLDQIVKDIRNCRKSDGKHLLGKKESVKYTNEKIKEQVRILASFPDKKLNRDIVAQKNKDIFHSLPLDLTVKEALKLNEKLLKDYIGWSDLIGEVDVNFWSMFGLVPMSLVPRKGEPYYYPSCNKDVWSKLIADGAKGLDEILIDGLSEKWSAFFQASGTVLSMGTYFDNNYKHRQKLAEIEATLFTSPYKTCKELEDEFDIKSIKKRLKEAARVFYLDKTKPMAERIAVFTEYGDVRSSIWEPFDPIISKMFSGTEYFDRHEMVNTVDVIENHMDCMDEYREEDRNYEPSEGAIERLKAYYLNKLFIEGVAKFEFDW